MTETARGIKAVLSAQQHDAYSKSAFLNKDILSEKAFEELSVYFEEKKFMLAFIARNTEAAKPERRWGNLPITFLSLPENNTRNVDFIYVQYYLSEDDTEETLQQFIESLKSEFFSEAEKFLWLEGKLQK